MTKYMYEVLKRENKNKGIVLLNKMQGQVEPRPPKKPSTRDLLIQFMHETKIQFKKINARLDYQENLLNKVIKLNNLKTK